MSQGQRNTGSHRARGRRGAEADLPERSLEALQARDKARGSSSSVAQAPSGLSYRTGR